MHNCDFWLKIDEPSLGTNESSKALDDKWHNYDKMTKLIIKRSLHETIKTSLINFNTANDLKNSKLKFAGTPKTNLSLSRQFMNMRFDNGSNIREQIFKMSLKSWISMLMKSSLFIAL